MEYAQTPDDYAKDLQKLEDEVERLLEENARLLNQRLHDYGTISGLRLRAERAEAEVARLREAR